MILGIRFEHVARQFKFIVVEKLLIVVNGFAGRSLLRQSAPRPLKVSFDQCPLLGKIHRSEQYNGARGIAIAVRFD